MKFLSKSIVFAALCAVVAAAPAAAQAPEERINVTFTPAIATVGDDTELALAGSAATGSPNTCRSRGTSRGLMQPPGAAAIACSRWAMPSSPRVA